MFLVMVVVVLVIVVVGVPGKLVLPIVVKVVVVKRTFNRLFFDRGTLKARR